MESDLVRGTGDPAQPQEISINMLASMTMIRKMVMENTSGQMDPSMKDSSKMT